MQINRTQTAAVVKSDDAIWVWSGLPRVEGTRNSHIVGYHVEYPVHISNFNIGCIVCQLSIVHIIHDSR